MPETTPPPELAVLAYRGAVAVLETDCESCPETIETQDGTFVCAQCAPREHTSCTGCGDWHRNDDSCHDCVTCDRCDNLTPESDTTGTIRGSTICDTCLSSHYWQCEDCDGWNRDGNSCANECCDPDTCQGCSDCTDNDICDLVENYSYRPMPVFHGDGPLFLGGEIEVEVPHHRTEECVAIAREYLGELGYLKEDASIGHGFEIVTHPMSYGWTMQHFPWKMLTHLRACGCDVSERTGMHVHVSRDAFEAPSHVFRWMKFIYRHEEQVVAVARRSSQSWAAFTDEDRRAAKAYAKGGHGHHRYRAINTTNYSTFELRVFASSLDPCQVQAAFAFTAASVEYTRELTVAMIVHHGGWSWSAFVDWLAERPEYAPLLHQLEQRPCAC